MSPTEPTRHDDEVLLTMMHMRDVEGLTARQIGERIGRSKNSVIGALYRQRQDDTDNGHLNGTLKPRWWKCL